MNKPSFRQNISIILAITGKDILDAVRNRTTISVLVSTLFVFFFYMFLPILEQEDIIRVYDAGASSWLPTLEHSLPIEFSVYDSLEELQSGIIHSGESNLGVVLPVGFDQAVASGSAPELQGYLLNWVSDKQALKLVAQAEAQIAAVIGVPVNISVERVFMLATSTGTGLSRAVGSILLVMMIGLVLVTNLILEEKRSRTMEALLVSPATPGQIAAGKALSGLFFCLLGFGLICLSNLDLVMQWGLVLLAGVAAALFTVVLGLLLGTLMENRQQMVIANVLIFPMLVAIFISVETSVFPAWLTTFARWMPLTAAFDLLRASFTPHTDPSFILPRLADALLFGFIILGFTAWKIQRSDWE